MEKLNQIMRNQIVIMNMLLDISGIPVSTDAKNKLKTAISDTNKIVDQ